MCKSFGVSIKISEPSTMANIVGYFFQKALGKVAATWSAEEVHSISLRWW